MSLTDHLLLWNHIGGQHIDVIAGEEKERKVVRWKLTRKAFASFLSVFTRITSTVIFLGNLEHLTKATSIIIVGFCFEPSFLEGDSYLLLNFILITTVR